MTFCEREKTIEMEYTSAGASVRSTGADVTAGASVGGDPPLQAGTA